MKLIAFIHQQRVRAGLWLDGDHVLDLGFARDHDLDTSSVRSILQSGNDAWAAIHRIADDAASFPGTLLATSEICLLSPLHRPARNPFCVGRNYLDHVKEGYAASGADVKLPKAPQFFTKATNTVIGDGAAIVVAEHLTNILDYEIELAVIIGRQGRDIAREHAHEHIFGYTIANDVTARDLQRRHDQWFKGKSLDTTLPLGPWIVDAETIGDPSTLDLSLTVNGEVRQHARISEMIFDIATLIESLSAGLTLEPGDVICTGTPSGVGYAMEPRRSLVDGDVVACTINRIGTLTNIVRRPKKR